MRQSTCSFGNDGCITGIGFGFTEVQVGDASHCQSLSDTFRAGNGDGERPYGSRLVNDQQYLCCFRSDISALSLFSSLGNALSNKHLPERLTATA